MSVFRSLTALFALYVSLFCCSLNFNVRFTHYFPRVLSQTECYIASFDFLIHLTGPTLWFPLNKVPWTSGESLCLRRIIFLQSISALWCHNFLRIAAIVPVAEPQMWTLPKHRHTFCRNSLFSRPGCETQGVRTPKDLDKIWLLYKYHQGGSWQNTLQTQISKRHPKCDGLSAVRREQLRHTNRRVRANCGTSSDVCFQERM